MEEYQFNQIWVSEDNLLSMFTIIRYMEHDNLLWPFGDSIRAEDSLTVDEAEINDDSGEHEVFISFQLIIIKVVVIALYTVWDSLA